MIDFIIGDVVAGERLTVELPILNVVVLRTVVLRLDDELVAYKTIEDYLLDLENYVASFKSGGYKITSYSPSASTDIEYFVEQDYECARGWCQFTIKSGKFYQVQQYVFILRKDEDSHWKIFGWQIVDE